MSEHPWGLTCGSELQAHARVCVCSLAFALPRTESCFESMSASFRLPALNLLVSPPLREENQIAVPRLPRSVSIVFRVLRRSPLNGPIKFLLAVDRRLHHAGHTEDAPLAARRGQALRAPHPRHPGHLQEAAR